MSDLAANTSVTIERNGTTQKAFVENVTPDPLTPHRLTVTLLASGQFQKNETIDLLTEANERFRARVLEIWTQAAQKIVVLVTK